LRWPKLRELKEAVTAVFSPRFTTRFPAEPCVVPEKYRGKPEFDLDTCIGCGACVNVCPAPNCLTMEDDLEADPPVRKIMAYTNPSLLIAKSSELLTKPQEVQQQPDKEIQTSDFMRILCPKCKCELNIRL